jgi:hypothetical protein
MAKLNYGSKADAYLEWATHTEFAHFGPVLPDANFVGVLVKWQGAQPTQKDLDAIAAVGTNALLATVYLDTAVASLIIHRTQIKALFDPSLSVDFVELASPVGILDRGNDPISPVIFPFLGDTPKVVIGCIDDGFPIASQRFFNGGVNRVSRFWNQEIDGHVAGKPLASLKTDPVAANFSYGRELIPALPADAYHLPTEPESADDQAFYQSRHLSRSLHRVTHGAHILDILTGPVSMRSRISPSRDVVNGNGDGSAMEPAPHGPDAGNQAANAPVVLVQLPRYALEDPSGRWLGHNVLDGIHYILETAKLSEKGKPEKSDIVINVSWGPQTGPHEGTSLLETAIQKLIDAEWGGGRELVVSIPAGNSYEARAHGQFKASAGCYELAWCVPPASQDPAFLEVWWPEGRPDADSQITVVAPDGSVLKSKGQGIWSQPGKAGIGQSWGVTQVKRGQGMMALIALAPTFSHDGTGAVAPHGVWKVSVEKIPTEASLVHVYVARADHNMGAKRRAQNSYLRDDAYEAARRSREAERTDAVPGSVVQKLGTLNGLGTNDATPVLAGYRLADGKPARYSSAGPVRAPASYLKPDWALPTDVSRMVRGVPAGGTRAGTVVNLMGTSTAAPQHAREAASVLAGGSFSRWTGDPANDRTGYGRG